MKKRTFTERRAGFAFAFLLGVACAGLLTCHATSPTHEGKPRDLRILQTWSGDYPVSQLNRLPEGQQISGTGYLGDAETFAAIWRAFKPGENLPDVDFKEHIVVFARNLEFYNRTNIFKVELRDGVAEIIAMETMSAIPIENKAAMALAVILREGVRFIQAGNEQVPVTNKESAVDPLNATYTIEDREFRLLDGRHEVEAAPGSATRIETSVFGDLVHGDLDGDGDDDAALLLVCAPGGSGTFYYVAAALNVNGGYKGTNAVLLGDRIAPQSILIQNGVIIANYADRRFEESMTAPPDCWGVGVYDSQRARTSRDPTIGRR